MAEAKTINLTLCFPWWDMNHKRTGTQVWRWGIVWELRLHSPATCQVCQNNKYSKTKLRTRLCRMILSQLAESWKGHPIHNCEPRRQEQIPAFRFVFALDIIANTKIHLYLLYLPKSSQILRRNIGLIPQLKLNVVQYSIIILHPSKTRKTASKDHVQLGRIGTEDLLRSVIAYERPLLDLLHR
jgi:hypothetical protein